MNRKMLCPQCRAEIFWSTTNPWRPFCSERCKLIDLGCWANESYRLPVQDTPEGSPSDTPSSPE